MKRGDCEFLFSGNTMSCKWMANRPVLLLSSVLERMNDILPFQRREKGSKAKPSVPCLMVVKIYNSDMGGVGLMNQGIGAYRLDRKSSVRFYLRIFFGLMDIACVNSSNKKHPKKLFLLDYKTFFAKNLIQYHEGR